MDKSFSIEKSKNQILTQSDFLIGTSITIVLLTVWIFGSSGMSLITTFVPGLAFAWFLFAVLYFKRIELPDYNIFLPLYLLTLGWQFIHFIEEFIMNFRELFPAIYGGAPYSSNTFVAFNMAAYFVFLISPVLVYFRGLKFLLIPALFFTVYGAMGNAISHSWWCIYFGTYFPGLYTALVYWLLAPTLLVILLKSKKLAAIFIIALTVVLLFTLTFFIR